MYKLNENNKKIDISNQEEWYLAVLLNYFLFIVYLRKEIYKYFLLNLTLIVKHSKMYTDTYISI